MTSQTMTHNFPEKRTEREQLELFIQTMFPRPSDLIEVRAVVSPKSQGGKGRLIARMWETPTGLISKFSELTRLNHEAKANLYFGVNPRIDKGGTKRSIAEVRCMWADFDKTIPQEALFRTASVLPMPTVIVSSGHGAHLYWRFAEPWSVASVHDAAKFEKTLQRMYVEVGADNTQDISRMLRLPGFLNQKSVPVPCTITALNSERAYAFTDFQRWIPQPDKHLDQYKLPKVENNARGGQGKQARSQTSIERIRELVSRLDEQVDDRSRRDFGVICGLLRQGLTNEEVWSLVQSRSKFAVAGRPYFDKTISNARSREQEISRS